MQVEEKCCNNLKRNTITEEEPTTDIITPSLQKSITNIIKKEGYITYNLKKKPITTDGGSYLASLCEVDIKGKTKDGEKETNIFIKIILDNEVCKDLCNFSDMYIREAFVYNDLSKMFTELQDYANIPLEERFKMVKDFGESNSEAIILENMSKKGFTTPDRMEVPPLKFIELSIQQLAKFHGLSFVMQKRKPVYFDNKIRSLNVVTFFNEQWKVGVENLAKITFKKFQGEDKKKAEDFIPVFLEKYPQYVLDKASSICCMCHGDYRALNILMKKTNGEVTEVFPVDFQALHYGCPVNDFIYFIYGCTDRKFRNKHLDSLKDMYFNTLRDFLQYFDMDVNNCYPRKEFETLYRHRFDHSLMIAMFFFPFIFAPEDSVPDFGKDDIAKLDYALNDSIHERVKEIFDECVELGFL